MPVFSPPRLLLVLFLCGYGFALVLLFSPGFHDFDLVNICRTALDRNYDPWFPAYITAFFRVLLHFVAPLRYNMHLLLLVFLFAVYVFTSSLGLRSWNKLLAALFLCAHPSTVALLLHPGRDSWFAVCGLLIVTLLLIETKRVRIQQTALGYTLLIYTLLICALLAFLMLRPEAAAAVVPFGIVFAVLKPQHKAVGHSSVQRLLISLSLLLLFGIIHLGLKYRLQPEQQLLSGTSYHTFLHDIVLITEYRGEDLHVPGFPERCRLEKSSISTLPYDTRGRVELSLRRLTNSDCYDYARSKRRLIEAHWRTLILQHPLQYLAARWTYIKALMGRTAELRAFPFGVAVTPSGQITPNLDLDTLFSDAVLTSCLGADYSPQFSSFASHLLQMVQQSGTLIIFDAWFYLVLQLVAGLLLWNIPREQRRRNIGYAVIASGMLYLLTIAAIGPTTSYRYLHWFKLSALLAVLLSLASRSSSRQLKSRTVRKPTK